MIKKALFSLLLPLSIYANEVYATFNVEALQEAKLSLSLPGIVRSLHVKIGDIVKKGDLLLELENSTELANIQLAKNEIELAHIATNHSKNDLLRYAKIKDVIDEELYEKIEYSYKKTALLEQRAIKAYDLQKVILAKKLLKAPYNGIISNKFVEVGDGITGANKVLLTLVNLKHVKLILEFDEKYWNNVNVGQTFTYKVDGLNKTLQGKISKVYPTVNSKSRKLKAEVLTSNILPGLFGDGQITVK